MLVILAVFAVASLVLYPLTRSIGRPAFAVAALIPAAAFVYTIAQAPTVLAGGSVREQYLWIAELGMQVSTRLDVLAWVMSLVVTGVGALVLLYCMRYFDADEEGLPRFASILLAFAGSMYGLVIADDVYLLFVFWEATTVFSYLLIGHYTGRRASRGAALQALLVTTFGGLAMLVGFVLLAVTAGTTQLSALVANPPEGAIVIVAIMLVLLGAVSKSALFPFHFWLPAAMAAPTPVSAYLHAAAMVKAGVYLIARLAPGYADIPGWREVLVLFGVITMLIGAGRALRQYDLKLLLAFGTVSQLGFLTVVVGAGSRDAALAGLALLIAHALYKSTLFLVVGIIDHRAGTRDLRKLSGLGRDAPALAVIAIVAAASMAGLPPLIGFVAKEAVFDSLLAMAGEGSTVGWVALAGVAVGSILTVAYTARLIWGAFSRKPGVESAPPLHRQRVDFLIAPAVLSAAGLVLGLLPNVVDSWVAGYADSFPPAREPYHLALWHGLTPALGLSVLVLVLGAGALLVSGWVNRSGWHVPEALGSNEMYWRILRGVDRGAARVTVTTQRGSLPFYLSVILIALLAFVGVPLVLNRTWPDTFTFMSHPVEGAVAILVIIAALAATTAQKRFQAVVLVGVSGYGMAALFALLGAPDLALTQVLVETVTLIAFVLVLRRLPARLGERHGSVHRLARAGIGVAVGLLMGTIALAALAARVDAPISDEMPRLAYEGGHGQNVVNVMLVDLRGWDTMGELSVVIAAATGVASLIFVSGRRDYLPRLSRRDAQERVRETLRRVADPNDATERGSWLLAGRTLAARNRSIMLEVVVRLVFHAIILLSIFLLLAGHNAPGGGFAGGLVAGLALVSRYLAGGRHELGAAAPLDAGKLLGAGLLFAAGTAAVPLLFGADALTSTWFELDLGWFGEIVFVTSTLFDSGVYLVVVGLTLDVLRSLGAEVDRHQEDAEQTEVRS
ncbi:Na+/H+ antiporter subunit A [Ruicaihuangia caeni]|uniref:Na+/H+ antiporter subunit A n=1 Tax=Ruicaihuangia caeni TaxID=3042517 RepID=A0AAW6T0M2_9MICO|nr:Na+/H+ antiporter subunit A [Klugiella sp. YN-L-19]MDI2097357.1 Na+/H+ antiporter subunit A [Klugiella sp. YN-L-19]